MKRINNTKRSLFLILMLSVLMCCSSCFPPNYTKDWAKQVAADHKPEVENWFAANMPEAKIKSCKALSSGTDLYAALRGEFKFGGESFIYVFDYHSQKMYSDRGYAEACSIITEQINKVLDLNDASLEYGFFGYSFDTISENNDTKHDELPKSGDPVSIPLMDIVPWGDPLDFAEKVLSGKESFEFSVDYYGKDFPEETEKIIAQYDNLIRLSAYVPIKAGVPGESSRRYSHEGAGTDYYTHIEKLEEGLYGGYSYYGSPDFEDKVVFTRIDRERFSLEIPEAASPLIFSDQDIKLYNCYENSKGEKKEEKIDSLIQKQCPGLDGYTLYGLVYIIQGDSLQGYRLSRMSNHTGIYEFRMEK